MNIQWHWEWLRLCFFQYPDQNGTHGRRKILGSVSRPGTTSGATKQRVSSSLSPESAQGSWDPLTSSSIFVPGAGHMKTSIPSLHPSIEGHLPMAPAPSAPSPKNFPAGHILASPQLPSWAGLTAQVEKHQSHSFHVKSSHCGLSSLGGHRAWRQGPAARDSQLLCLRSRPTAHQSPRHCGEGLLLPCLPQQRFGTGGLGRREQSLMVLTACSLLPEARGLGLKRRCPLWSLSVLGPDTLCMHQPPVPQ